MSPIIQDPTTSRKLQRGLRLTSLPDGILAPEIVGVVLLEDWSEPLGDVSRGCTGVGAIGATALENSHITLVRVGLGDPYDLVVTRLWFSSTTTQEIRVMQPTALSGQSAQTNTSFSDFSIPGRPTSQIGALSQVGVVAGRRLLSARVLADTTYRFEVKYRLGTFGDGVVLTALVIAAATVNTDLFAGFDWTEASPLG